MATKTKKVKWGLDDPGELQEFETNDDIIRKNKGKLPPKGVTRLRLIKLTRVTNRNDDPMLKILVAIDEADKGAPAFKWNGYTSWENQNVTKQGAPFLKRFLNSLGVSWSDFNNKTSIDPLTDPEEVVAIGSVKIGTDAKKPVYLWGVLKSDTYEGEDRMKVSRWLPPRDEDIDEDDDDDDDDDDAVEMDEVEVEEDVEDDDSDDDDDDDDDEDEEDDDDDEDEEDSDRLAVVSGLNKTELRELCLENGRSKKELKGLAKEDLLAMVIEDEDLPPF